MPKVARHKTPLEASIPLACADEAAAVAFLEAQRWGDSPNCPRCGDTDVSMMKAKDGSRNARFLWRCKGCKQQYTVKIGTIMEDSPIPFRHWCLAFYRAAASKKGVSALQIQRETGLTYKSALFLMHRIRWAMAPANEQESKLGANGGVVEFDETYVGGKPRGVPNWALATRDGEQTDEPTYNLDGTRRRKKGPAPDFKDRKTPVVAGVERGGRVKAHVVANVTPETLSTHVRNMVDTSATLNTDERASYKTVGEEYAAHNFVKHSRAEWRNGDAYTNTIEGFFSQLKRQINGTHHSVTRKHLHRYVTEVEFKYNTRVMNDGERTVRLIQAADHRRLTYKQQTSKP
ncbi:MAG: IS1595 family transposase [bacterium]